MKILSSNNPKIKELFSLLTQKFFRIQQKIFIVEGQKEIQIALKKYRPHELFLYKKKYGYIFSIRKKFSLVIELTSNAFHKLSYIKENGGFLATFHRHDIYIKDLHLPKNPILLLLEGIEKPGNLGAVFRSAEAIGTDVVILFEIKTDIFHTNVVRSSLGTIFSHNVVIFQLAKFNDLIKLLKKHKISILTTSIKENTINIFDINLRIGIVIIVGNESLGLSNHWINSSNTLLKIPMQGNIDSLNVSNAVAIVLFEVLRQRMGI